MFLGFVRGSVESSLSRPCAVGLLSCDFVFLRVLCCVFAFACFLFGCFVLLCLLGVSSWLASLLALISCLLV